MLQPRSAGMESYLGDLPPTTVQNKLAIKHLLPPTQQVPTDFNEVILDVCQVAAVLEVIIFYLNYSPQYLRCLCDIVDN